MKNAQTVCEAKQPAMSVSPLVAEHQRLQKLVSELIMSNQELRFKVAGLEAELEKQQRGLKAATEWAGMLF